VRRAGDLTQRARARFDGQTDLQQPDDLAAFSDRRQRRPPVVRGDHLHRLAAQHLLLRATVERQHGGHLVAVTPAGRRRTGCDVRQSDQRPTAEIGDQEGDTAGIQPCGELAGDRLDGLHR